MRVRVRVRVRVSDHLRLGVELRVRFTQGYPLQGGRPSFELLHDMPSSELPQVG